MTFDLDSVVIKVEEGVERKVRRMPKRIDLENDERAIMLRGMTINSSFFLEGAKKPDVRPLIDLGKKINVFLIARELECDEIYQVAGVRIWRVEESDLPRRGAKATPPVVEQKAQVNQVDPDEDF